MMVLHIASTQANGRDSCTDREHISSRRNANDYVTQRSSAAVKPCVAFLNSHRLERTHLGVLREAPLGRARLARDDHCARALGQHARLEEQIHITLHYITLHCARPAWKSAAVTRSGPSAQMSICLSCSAKFRWPREKRREKHGGILGGDGSLFIGSPTLFHLPTGTMTRRHSLGGRVKTQHTCATDRPRPSRPARRSSPRC